MRETEHPRFRNRTISIRVSPEESAQIEARIKVTGLSKSEYYIKTFLQQEIKIAIGKYQSDRLSLEFRRLRERIEQMKVGDEVDFFPLWLDCKALLTELKPLVEKNTQSLEKGKFEALNGITEDKENVSWKRM